MFAKSHPFRQAMGRMSPATSLVLLGFLPFAVSSCSNQNSTRESGPLEPASSSTMIQIDGFFEDWGEVEVVHDDSGDAPGAELDIGTLQIHGDGRYLHLLIGLNREVNVQRLDGTLEVLVNGDGKTDTGVQKHGMPGVDLTLRFSPEDPERPDSENMGVTVSSATHHPSDPSEFLHHSNVGFSLAPTHASDRIECRVDRNSTLPDTPGLFQGESVSFKLVLIDADREVSDQTEVVSHSLPRVESSERGTTAEDLPSKPPGSFRVATWNVQNGSILEKPDLYSKMLAKLAPDILLLQEMEVGSAQELVSILAKSSQDSSPGDSWQVVFGQGGGPLRCAIASRFPMESVGSLELIPYPDRPDRSVRTTGGQITLEDRRILVAPVHLKCCGRIDSWEDQRRREEVNLINQAVAEAKELETFDAIVIGGDLNLVGSYSPITLLGANLDLDQSDLSIVEPYHFFGNENSTWASPVERFAPGRLDFLLYSDSSILPANSFVFDTDDLSASWLANSSLTRDSSATASDHLPVVADFVWSE